MRTRHRTRSITIAASAAALLVSLLGSTTTALATGTCPGNKLEVVIPSEQMYISPLAVYDKNGDGIVCNAANGRFKRDHYTDNRI